MKPYVFIWALAALPGLCGPAHAADYTAYYFLPKANVAGAVTHTLVRCPGVDGADVGAEVVVAGALVTKYVADPSRQQTVALSTQDFWVGRKVDLKLRENGTLESFGADVRGAGGEAIAALFKGVVKLATFAAPPGPLMAPAVKKGSCTPKILELTKTAAELEAAITHMQVRMANATGDEAVRLRVEIDKAGKRLAEVREPLTLTASAAISPATRKAVEEPDVFWSAEMKPFTLEDYQGWFAGIAQADLTTLKLPGLNGYLVTIEASAPMQKTIVETPAAKADKSARVGYVRPIPATAALCAKNAEGKCDKAVEVLAKTPVGLPQRSPIFHLPVSGGAFANRAITASFAESGAMTAVTYTTQAQAGEIAKAMAGAVETIQTARDAGQTERERGLKELQTRVEIRKAEAELAKPVADTAGQAAP